eukprot:1159018-Pelagomonas_calceolata.AAC.7
MMIVSICQLSFTELPAGALFGQALPQHCLMGGRVACFQSSTCHGAVTVIQHDRPSAQVALRTILLGVGILNTLGSLKSLVLTHKPTKLALLLQAYSMIMMGVAFSQVVWPSFMHAVCGPRRPFFLCLTDRLKGCSQPARK